MGAWGWKIKRLFRQMMPFAIAAAVAWTGYTMFFAGSGFRSPKTAVMRVFRSLPYFGSRFRGGRSEARSYRYGRSSRSYRRYHSPRRSRYHARSTRRHGRRRR